MSRSADDIRRLFESAAEILGPLQLHDGVVTGPNLRAAMDGAVAIQFAVDCPPTDEPIQPTTRDAALPHLLLRGPFKGAPQLQAVAFYIGLGFITVREVSATRSTYEITAIEGDGIERRLAFLIAARDLFFNDAQLERSPS